ncbi:histidinol-phosphate transaminase [Flavobacterium oreochromis]|uniref:Histidinol-phosphate aminotransferase n=2 Tax=Flavobacterium TaxID=237 RepID=A0A246G7V5_9FLAO|nr:histidinol-phosphate transaminase [Flavobacterium oreochromis]OWP74685.1 histidinol-phosphate transaminase [Flavobacterium oreochromis]OWP74699.1 histidinol-phosphate transaminase [Flavobacterium oreochromis]POR21999.1 histidinol-phosphate transaminase [Flavobacterium columnare]
MIQIKKLIRSNILSLTPYSSARDEFNTNDGIFLDANENPFGYLNRYPDPYQKELKDKLGLVKNITPDNIFIGNGSDEVIDLAYRIFCEPALDKIIICPPTYGMYKVAAHINNIQVITIPLNQSFQLDIDRILSTEAKMIFICSPNNPTGNHIENIETIIKNFRGIVFIDEAYIDFSMQESLLQKVKKYPNIIVSQTLSKAWGKAAIRIGIAYASKEIIDLYTKIKPPYNISKINQEEAIKALNDIETFIKNKQIIIEQRTWLIEELNKLPFVKKIYPTQANFILLKVEKANIIYQKLIQKNIIIRNRHTVIQNTLRISIGQPHENKILINILKDIKL